MVEHERVGGRLVRVEQRSEHKLAQVKETQAHEIQAKGGQSGMGLVVGQEQETDEEHVEEKRWPPVDPEVNGRGQGRVADYVSGDKQGCSQPETQAGVPA